MAAKLPAVTKWGIFLAMSLAMWSQTSRQVSTSRLASAQLTSPRSTAKARALDKTIFLTPSEVFKRPSSKVERQEAPPYLKVMLDHWESNRPSIWRDDPATAQKYLEEHPELVSDLQRELLNTTNWDHYVPDESATKEKPSWIIFRMNAIDILSVVAANTTATRRESREAIDTLEAVSRLGLKSKEHDQINGGVLVEASEALQALTMADPERAQRFTDLNGHRFAHIRMHIAIKVGLDERMRLSE